MFASLRLCVKQKNDGLLLTKIGNFNSESLLSEKRKVTDDW